MAYFDLRYPTTQLAGGTAGPFYGTAGDDVFVNKDTFLWNFELHMGDGNDRYNFDWYRVREYDTLPDVVNQLIDGGSGFDIVDMSTQRSDWTTKIQFKGIERIWLPDGHFTAFDTPYSDIGGLWQVMKAMGDFDFTPEDNMEQQYIPFWWLRDMIQPLALIRSDGQSNPFELTRQFVEDPQWNSIYPTDKYGSLNTMDNGQFLSTLYAVMMDRAPDQGGYDYWLNNLNNGQHRGDVFFYFANSPEYAQITGTPIVAIDMRGGEIYDIYI